MSENQLTYPDKVQKVLDEGKLWRAKEILNGHLSNQPYSSILYKQYGSVLLQMGDSLNAGLYLFLAGSTDPEHQNAIDHFLKRYGRKSWTELMQSFPGKIWVTKVFLLPKSVQEKLLELGMPKNKISRSFHIPHRPTKPASKSSDRFMEMGCFFVGVFLLTSVLVGAYTIVVYLF